MINNPKKLRTDFNKGNLFVVTTPSEEKVIINKKISNQYTTKFQNDITTTANSNDISISKQSENDINTSNISNEYSFIYFNYNFQNEYLDEIYINLLLDEKKFEKKINPEYLSFQNSINDKMRAILIDWIIEIHSHYNFVKKTLHQCVFIIDAFLSNNILDKSKLQLLGVSSLLISCKENEIIYPSLKKFIQLTDNAYTIEELTKMERKIIQALNFDILSPTAEEFFEINADYFKLSEKQKIFGEFFLECSLIDYNMLKYKQSTIAITCGYITMKYFNLKGIKLILDNANFGIKRKEIINCSKELCLLVKNLNKSSLGVVKKIVVNKKINNFGEL